MEDVLVHIIRGSIYGILQRAVTVLENFSQFQLGGYLEDLGVNIGGMSFFMSEPALVELDHLTNFDVRHRHMHSRYMQDLFGSCISANLTCVSKK